MTKMQPLQHDEIICTPSGTRVSAGGWLTINRVPRYDLQWLGAGNAGVVLFPLGGEPVRFDIGEDLAFRRFVEAWHRSHPVVTATP